MKFLTSFLVLSLIQTLTFANPTEEQTYRYKVKIVSASQSPTLLGHKPASKAVAVIGHDSTLGFMGYRLEPLRTTHLNDGADNVETGFHIFFRRPLTDSIRESVKTSICESITTRCEVTYIEDRIPSADVADYVRSNSVAENGGGCIGNCNQPGSGLGSSEGGFGIGPNSYLPPPRRDENSDSNTPTDE